MKFIINYWKAKPAALVEPRLRRRRRRWTKMCTRTQFASPSCKPWTSGDSGRRPEFGWKTIRKCIFGKMNTPFLSMHHHHLVPLVRSTLCKTCRLGLALGRRRLSSIRQKPCPVSPLLNSSFFFLQRWNLCRMRFWKWLPPYQRSSRACAFQYVPHTLRSLLGWIWEFGQHPSCWFEKGMGWGMGFRPWTFEGLRKLRALHKKTTRMVFAWK